MDRRSDAVEIMDGAEFSAVELSENFRDIRRVNRLLGGTATVLRHLPALLNRIDPVAPATVLDLATGAGDIPVAIVRYARRERRSVSIVASDFSDEILALARDETSGYSEITLSRQDARAVQFPDNSFDIVLCSLALHHFAPRDAVQVLKEMTRLARVGMIVNDLRRSRPGFAAAWFAARATTRNRLTRNDAPLSVRRAYTPTELTGLLRAAGVHDATISKHLWFRMAAVSPREHDED